MTGASQAQHTFAKASQRKKFENHCFSVTLSHILGCQKAFFELCFHILLQGLRACFWRENFLFAFARCTELTEMTKQQNNPTICF